MPLPRPLTFQASADPGWAFTGCPDGMVACSPQYLVLGSDIAMGHSYSLLANAPILPNGRLRTAAGGSPPNQVRCGVLSGKTSRAVRELGGPPLLLLTPCGSSAVPSVSRGTPSCGFRGVTVVSLSAGTGKGGAASLLLSGQLMVCSVLLTHSPTSHLLRVRDGYLS